MLNKWCDKIWLYVLYSIGIVMSLFLFFNWNTWSDIQKMITSFTVIVPLHVLEEWQIPGGFHYQMDNFMESVHYPVKMNRMSDMITNLGATLVFLGLAVYGANTGITIMVALFSCAEVIIHTTLGVQMYKKFNKNGKKTFYGPGSITAYLGFGVTGVLSIKWLLENGTVMLDWFIGIGIFAAIIAGLLWLPTVIFQSGNIKYAFLSQKYFNRFL